MTNQTIRSTELNFNSVQRRGLLAGAGLLAAAVVSCPFSPPPAIAADPSIALMGRRLKSLIESGEAASSAKEGQRIYRKQEVLETALINMQPSCVEDALIIVMQGLHQISCGRHERDNEDQIEVGEQMVRGALFWLADHSKVDLEQFGGAHYSPRWLVPAYEVGA